MQRIRRKVKVIKGGGGFEEAVVVSLVKGWVIS